MRFNEAISRQRLGLAQRTLPSLRELEQSVDKVLSQWPDAITIPLESSREKISLEFLDRVLRWDWKNVPVSRLLQAAVAAFDEIRASRIDLLQLHDFLIEEIKTSTVTSFLSGMVWVYIGSFEYKGYHTNKMADALASRIGFLGQRAEFLLKQFPALFKSEQAPLEIAKIMLSSDEPYNSIQELGFPSPHAPGLMTHVGALFLNLIADKLHEDVEQERLFSWLAPKNRDPIQTNSDIALVALLRPWISRSIEPDRQSRLSEWIVANYGDPRTQRGGVWPGFNKELKDVLLRWLTREDMNFFCEVVSATQNSHMWPPRRNFWLRLHEQGRIDQAWVAFGSAARDFARKNLIKDGATNLSNRFGRQLDRGGGTSLLIMQIGRKIVVDGCHNYRTHIFDIDDKNSPKLYQSEYKCDSIMNLARLSQQHHPVAHWERWVERHI